MKPAAVQLYLAWFDGIKNPLLVWNQAKAARIPFYVACAFLMQESDGGANVFGHDDSIFRGAGKVTKAKYLEYKKQRDAQRPRRMQGVGPMQLTWYTFQDWADELGGCWNPKYNLLVGFKILRGYWLETSVVLSEVDRWRRVGARYNGSESYGYAVAARVSQWKRRFS